jgi:tripartite ATP-independent transporter DctP family solute receptor
MEQRIKRVLAFTLCVAVVLAFSACGGGGGSAHASGDTSTAPEGEVFNIIYSGTLPDEHPIMVLVKQCAEDMKEKSGGRLNMTVYTNNQLGDSRQAFEGMQNNSIQVGEMSTAPLSGFTDLLNPVNLPFFFDDADQAIAFVNSDYFKNTIGDKMAEVNSVRPITAFYNGPRSLSNSKRPVVTPEDMKGLKIRVMESPIYIKTFESLNASPTPMSFAELFTGLQQKTIDGQDNGPTITVSNKLYEAQSYFTDLNYIHDLGPVVVSEQFYQSLPEDLRAIFLECFENTADQQHEIGKADVEKDIETIGTKCEITRLTDEQRAAFKAKVQPVYDWFASEYPDLDVDAYRAAAEGK